MPANEVANLVLAQVTFIATNPPTIVRRNANVSGVTRNSLGNFVVALVDKLPAGTTFNCPVNFQTTSQISSGATFAGSQEVSGDVLVQARDVAGALADTGARIDVLVTAYPTVS